VINFDELVRLEVLMRTLELQNNPAHLFFISDGLGTDDGVIIKKGQHAICVVDHGAFGII
jgi:hypothetical protein